MSISKLLAWAAPMHYMARGFWRWLSESHSFTGCPLEAGYTRLSYRNARTHSTFSCNVHSKQPVVGILVVKVLPYTLMPQARILHICTARAKQRSLPALPALLFTPSLLLSAEGCHSLVHICASWLLLESTGPNEECNAASSVSSCFLPHACQQR